MSPVQTLVTAGDFVAVLPSRKEGKTPIFAVLAKRTYELAPDGSTRRAEPGQPLQKVDAYYDDGDAETATVQYESDLMPYKLATDVVVIARAYTSKGRPMPQVDAAVEVAGRRKIIRIIGDRRCVYRPGRPPQFTEPLEFTTMEIRYERAYGGQDLKSVPGLPFFYPRNPQGTGVAIKNLPEVVEGLALPNLEDAADLLTPERIVMEEMERWNSMPLPQGFGWYQKTWYPRCSFIGAVPGFVDSGETMREEALGLVPKGQISLARRLKLPSFDLRFGNGASPGLVFPYLSGGELIRLMNLTPAGLLQFHLPRDPPGIALDIGLGQSELKPMLHTVVIRIEEMQVDLVWRGDLEYPGVDWLPEMKRLHVEVT